MIRGLSLVALAALGAALLLVSRAPLTRAQVAAVPGVIEGEVRPGPGATVEVDGVPVQLLGLSQGAPTLQETRTAGGRFRFDLPSAGGNATYIVRAQVDGVTYLAPTPVLLSPEVPTARVGVLVYAATSERPPLTSQATGITVVFVDVNAGKVTLQREDLVLNPGTRTWLGDADGVTLRLPAPARLDNLEGEAWYEGLPAVGEFALAGSEVVTRLPFRPGVTLVTTRYTVPVDLAAPEEILSVSAALPAERLQVLVPERFARGLEAGPAAVVGSPVTIEGERLLVVESPGSVASGAALEARVRGLGGRLEPGPLAGRTGALLGALLALAIIGGGAPLVSLVAARRVPPDAVEGA